MCQRFREAAILLALCRVIFCCFVGATAADAQQAVPATQSGSSHEHPPNPDLTLRVATRLVEVSVVVNDKHGSPISALNVDDFELFDHKKRQEIRIFAEEKVEAAAASTRAPTANTYSNRINPQQTRSVTVVLLDTLNTDFGDQALAQKQLLKFLATLQPQDQVALYWLGEKGIRVLQDFTTNSSALREAAIHLKAEWGQRLANSEVPDDTSPTARLTAEHAYFRSAFEQHAANSSTQDRARLTVAALITIANHLRPLMGSGVAGIVSYPEAGKCVQISGCSRCCRTAVPMSVEKAIRPNPATAENKHKGGLCKSLTINLCASVEE